MKAKQPLQSIQNILVPHSCIMSDQKVNTLVTNRPHHSTHHSDLKHELWWFKQLSVWKEETIPAYADVAPCHDSVDMLPSASLA